MKKIPTLFVRNPDDRRHVLDEVTPGCEWVLAGEGVATRKYDGTCCLVRDGKLYRRHEVKPGKTAPADFEPVDHDEETGKTVGWVPVGDGPEDRWHREAWDNEGGWAPDGTYELLGPKVQGNPEGYDRHELVAHADAQILTFGGTTTPTGHSYESLRDLLTGGFRYEGIVWHHPDGRMAKLKRRDFR